MSITARDFPSTFIVDLEQNKRDRSAKRAVFLYIMIALLGNAPIALILGGNVAWKIAWCITDGLLLLIACFAFKPPIENEQSRFRAIGYSLWILIVYFYVSSLWSPNIFYSAVASVYLLTVTLAASSLAASQIKTHVFLRAALTASIALLAIDYIAVELFPDIGIDNSAFTLAGSWRGVHIQKNFAGAVYAIVALVSAECFRRRIRRFSSFSVLALAIIFLFNSGSKTAIGLLAIVKIASDLLIYVLQARTGERANRLSYIFIAAIVPTIFSILVFYVFSTNSEPLDTTLTGRTQVWTFAYDSISQNPFFGYGYLGFWRDPIVQAKTSFELGWQVPHAHNSFLDILLSGGVIISLFYVVVIFSPILYLARISRDDLKDSGIFIQIWLFSLLQGMMESSLLLEQEYGITALFLFSIMQLREKSSAFSRRKVSYERV